MSNPGIPDFEAIKRAIGERHLEQLSHFDLVGDPLESLPIFATYDDMVQWTNDSKGQILNGTWNRVYGGQFGSPIGFNNAFVAFMESAAMYLRDSSKVLEAVKTYQSGSNTEEALRLLHGSTAQIESLAEMWGMHFIQICDFVTRHPDGHRFLVGPFCGAFFPKNFSGSSPYIGVAFKGTSSIKEWINDLAAMGTVRASGRLWGSQVAKGFYYPIFSTYSSSPMPFALVEQAIQNIATKATMTAITHVTGHSLGGAYSSLCYAQLCIKGLGTLNASLGDLYTFGSPRVGRGDFAQPLKAAVCPPGDNGSAWRIVNKGDYITKLPVSPPWPLSFDPFIHIDAAYTIYPNLKPVAQPSEIGTHPPVNFPRLPTYHYTTEYYKSLTYATTLKSPAHAVTSWGMYPLSISTFSNPNLSALNMDTTCSAEISMEIVRDCIVTTIKQSCFFGEITALGTIGLLTTYKKLGGSATFKYHDWKSLYAKENQCVFGLASDNLTLAIGFIVDGIQVAVALFKPNQYNIGGVAVTRGSCIWTFSEDTKVTEAEDSIAAAAAGIFT